MSLEEPQMQPQDLPNKTSAFDLQTLEQLLNDVTIPDNSLDRLTTFENLILQAFVDFLVSHRMPELAQDLNLVLTKNPKVSGLIQDRLGQLGISALAGVGVVMLKRIPSSTVHAALPGITIIFLHHLLEVVSDKLYATDIASQRNIPPDLIDVFSDASEATLQHDGYANAYMDLQTYLHTHRVGAIQGMTLLRVFVDFLYKGVESLTGHKWEAIKAPLRHALLFNLDVIQIANQHLVQTHPQDPNSPLGDLNTFARIALLERYQANQRTHNIGYYNMDLDSAVQTRAESILTNYTMAAMLAAICDADAAIAQDVESDIDATIEAIQTATTIIGLANDCGSILLRSDVNTLQKIISDHKATELTGTEFREMLREKRLLNLAKRGKLPKQHIPLYTLIKDADKGEPNLVFDLRFNQRGGLSKNLVDLSERFQGLEAKLSRQLGNLHSRVAAEMIENFVVYNFQIYERATDYDQFDPIIRTLPCITGESA